MGSSVRIEKEVELMWIIFMILFFIPVKCFGLNPNHFNSVQMGTAPICILHFDEGSGTTATDHSNLKNSCTNFAGNVSWVNDGLGGSGLAFPDDTLSRVRLSEKGFEAIFNDSIPNFTVHWRMKYDFTTAATKSYIYTFSLGGCGSFVILRASNTIHVVDDNTPREEIWNIENSTFGSVGKWHTYDLVKYRDNPPNYELFVDGVSLYKQTAGGFNPGMCVGENFIGGASGGKNSCNCQIGEFDIYKGAVDKHPIQRMHYETISHSN